MHLYHRQTQSLIVTFALACFFCLNAYAWTAQTLFETPIFDSNGMAVAYIDNNDNRTVYLWSGEAVAYLEGSSLYRFDGKHLAWLEYGILWGHDGFIVGFTPEANLMPTQPEPIKGFKQTPPIPSIPPIEAPPEPRSNEWSVKTFRELVQ